MSQDASDDAADCRHTCALLSWMQTDERTHQLITGNDLNPLKVQCVTSFAMLYGSAWSVLPAQLLYPWLQRLVDLSPELFILGI